MYPVGAACSSSVVESAFQANLTSWTRACLQPETPRRRAACDIMIAMQGEKDADQDSGFELAASIDMVEYCFDVLIHHLTGGSDPVPTFDQRVKCPLFVTWEKEGRSGHRQLRGCIGTLSPKSLASLKDYVFSSAFRDRRFDPIAAHEIPKLKCSVSLLVQYEDADHHLDWEVGRHGIIINFRDKHHQPYSATYLPEVAAEQRWTKLEAVESLVRKSGYQGRVDESLMKRITLTRYQSSKVGMEYKQYVEIKEGRTVPKSIPATSSTTESETEDL